MNRTVNYNINECLWNKMIRIGTRLCLLLLLRMLHPTPPPLNLLMLRQNKKRLELLPIWLFFLVIGGGGGGFSERIVQPVTGHVLLFSSHLCSMGRGGGVNPPPQEEYLILKFQWIEFSRALTFRTWIRMHSKEINLEKRGKFQPTEVMNRNNIVFTTFTYISVFKVNTVSYFIFLIHIITYFIIMQTFNT